MSRYRLSEQASEDLIAIYIQGYDLFGPAQADRYQDSLTDLFERLSHYPGLAWLRAEHDPPVRIFAHKAHLVVYEDEPEGIFIVRVRHAHEDWQNDPTGNAGDRE